MIYCLTKARPSKQIMGKEETRLLIEFNKQYNKAMVSDKDITETEVRGLFDLWNAALATGDSKVVAGRYTKVRCGMIFVYDVYHSPLFLIVIDIVLDIICNCNEHTIVTSTSTNCIRRTT